LLIKGEFNMLYFVRVTYAPTEGLGERSYPIYSTDDIADAHNVANQLEQLKHIICAIVTTAGKGRV